MLHAVPPSHCEQTGVFASAKHNERETLLWMKLQALPLPIPSNPSTHSHAPHTHLLTHTNTSRKVAPEHRWQHLTDVKNCLKLYYVIKHSGHVFLSWLEYKCKCYQNNNDSLY